jgi:capsular polysaccharide transport system permease protein
MRSNEMYSFLDKIYNLSGYYTSEKLDEVQRLYKDSRLPLFRASRENLLKKYNQDLSVIFDEPSGTLSLSFLHTDRNVSREILQSIIDHSEVTINQFAKENARVALRFIEDQREENKAHFINSIKSLIQYQNKHNTIDPNIDVESKSAILATLESEKIQKEVEYSSKLNYMNQDTYEMKLLKDTIGNIISNITKIKSQMAGGTGSQESELNTNVFDFELLKNEMEFDKEIYRQTLISQEKLKIEVNQNAKHLVIISKPTLADSYSEPNKPRSIFTLIVILLFLYSIIVTIFTIIRDHRD